MSPYRKQVGFKTLYVNKKTKERNIINQTDDNNDAYNCFLFDNVHLNDRFGVSWLKNWTLSHLLLSSNGQVVNTIPSNKMHTAFQGRSGDAKYAIANKIQFNREHRYNSLYGSKAWQHQYNPNFAENASYPQYCNTMRP